MEANHSTHPAGGGGPRATERHPGVRGCYLTPSPLEDVLFEQLRYLISHAGHHPSERCSDCDRLDRVLGPLLEPFRA